VKRKTEWLMMVVTLSLAMPSAQATVIGLFDYAFNIDGTTSDILFDGDPLPGNVNIAGFDELTGLGTVEVTIAGAGDHTVVGFFDHDIDLATNLWFNEEGTTGGGAVVAGQSWEIDEPGFFFGDIFFNVQDSDALLGSFLDNTNAVPSGSPDDVSMAMGFDFTLAATETAIVSFFLDTINNAPGFFLQQSDPDSIINEFQGPNELFFWAGIEIRGEGVVGVPEPGTLGLLGLGLIMLAGRRRRLQ